EEVQQIINSNAEALAANNKEWRKKLKLVGSVLSAASSSSYTSCSIFGIAPHWAGAASTFIKVVFWAIMRVMMTCLFGILFIVAVVRELPVAIIKEEAEVLDVCWVWLAGSFDVAAAVSSYLDI
ncbi:hypothetical protein HKX48_002809, partial [Thoreauomyces humboldtii]